MTKKILILGGTGLVGKALIREYSPLKNYQILAPTRQECNLRDQKDTQNYFEKNRPEHVVVAAARVGGIVANDTYSGDFILENLSIITHSFEAAHRFPPERLLFLGSSCIYPKHCPQPMKEEHLLTGPLETSNEAYAISKIAGLKLAMHLRKQYKHDFISAMPTNLYGVGDNYNPEQSHVIPGLIVRMQKAIDTRAPTFEVWGSGKPFREFLYMDDLARACRFILEAPGRLPDIINVGCGEDISIADLANMIKELMGYEGKIVFNTTVPDGTPKKLLDISRITALGWKPQMNLRVGIANSIKEFRSIRHS